MLGPYQVAAEGVANSLSLLSLEQESERQLILKFGKTCYYIMTCNFRLVQRTYRTHPSQSRLTL